MLYSSKWQCADFLSPTKDRIYSIWFVSLSRACGAVVNAAASECKLCEVPGSTLALSNFFSLLRESSPFHLVLLHYTIPEDKLLHYVNAHIGQIGRAHV